jgi:uncharacterized coiled-coil DUF342 family protein
MAQYTIKLVVDGKNINTVKKQVAAAFPDQSSSVQKIGDASSRNARLDDARDAVQDAAQTVQELHDEMQDWYDNMPENFQNGDKGSEVQEEAEALEQLKDELEGIDFDRASNFPGMY